MSNLYKRKVYIAIGQEVDNEDVIVMPDTLRVAFSVDKTASSEPNRCIVRIFNLNSSSRGKIEKQGNVITVRAGYEDDYINKDTGAININNLPIITRADINYTRHVKRGGDIVTEIEGGEGEVAFRASFVNETLKPNSDVESIFNSLINSFIRTQINSDGIAAEKGFSVATNFFDVISSSIQLAKSNRLAKAAKVYSTKYLNGASLYGFSREIFNNLAERHDLVWFLDNNILTIAPIAGSLDNTPLVITPNNGLIEKPERLENGGVFFRMLLNPAVSIWSRHILQDTESFDGTYKIGRAVFSGDTNAKSWYNAIEALQV